jgi:ribonuclease G
MLRVHPFTAAYLNRKVPNHPTRWFLKHRIRVRMEIDPKLDPMAYRFIEVRSGKDITEIPVNGQGG